MFQSSLNGAVRAKFTWRFEKQRKMKFGLKINTSGGCFRATPPRAPRTTHSIHARHVEGDTCSAMFFLK